MRVIRAAEHVPVPWKNGGGTATAIAAEPQGAGFDDFDWRLAGARVAAAGPFSHFPGVDRVMLILSGGSLVLDGLAAGRAILTKASAPFAFPGDVPVTAEVPEGPIDNLNLMVDRRRFRASARRIALGPPQAIAAAGTLLVYCEAGAIEAGGLRLGPGDTLVAREAVTLSGRGDAIVLEVLPAA
jgi:uncharacterized protein